MPKISKLHGEISQTAALAVGIAGMVGLATSVVLWGLVIWLPLYIFLWGLAVKLKGASNIGMVAIGLTAFGLGISVYLWGLPFWLLIITGHAAIALIITHFLSPFSVNAGRAA